jgi:hypothetical protein
LPLKKHLWLKEQLIKKNFIFDSETCHLVRMTLMNPFLMTKETQAKFTDDFAKILNHISRSERLKKKSKLPTTRKLSKQTSP